MLGRADGDDEGQPDGGYDGSTELEGLMKEDVDGTIVGNADGTDESK